MTNYRILSITVEDTNQYGLRTPERRIEAHIQVGMAARLASVVLTRREAYNLASQLLAALYRTGETQ